MAAEELHVAPRRFGAANWRGAWSLYRREVLRFLRSAGESLGGPAASSLLFLAVFVLALEGTGDMAPGVSVAQFVAPGIVIFTMVHSAFENAAVPILYDKLEGMISDVLSAPLTPLEVVLAYALAAATNALLAGASVLLLMAVFVELPLHAPGVVLVFAPLAALAFAFLGVTVGLWSDRWDNYSAAETFLILPLGLLSGAFFSVSRAPEEARWLFELNPVFHAVTGFRFGFTGIAEAPVAWSLVVLLALVGGLWLLAWRLFAVGYKIKP